MIRSMTGYGSSSVESDALKAAVTVKSLNHRFLEVGVSLPRHLAFLEPDVRGLVQSKVRRGKVDLSVRAQRAQGSSAEGVVASEVVVAGLVKTLRALRAEHGLGGDVTVADVARFPGALEVVEAPQGEGEGSGPGVIALVEEALKSLDEMRRREGEHLSRELEARLASVAAAATKVEALSEETRKARRDALAEKARTLVQEMGVDDGKLYQEVVRLVERSDVAEEVQRLRSHVEKCHALLEEEGPSGKRFDFIAQELMREANTIGSKALSAPMAHEVVALKSEIERFREQVQNVE